MQNILIIQTAWLGDIILSTGILETIHKAYPDADIDLVIQEKYKTIFIDHPYIRMLYFFNKKQKIKSLRQIVKRINKKRYDLLINTHRYISTGVMSLLIRAEHKVGYKNNPLSICYDHAVRYDSEDKRHETDRLHDLLVHLSLHKEKMNLYLPHNYKAENLPKEYICIAPCSAWPFKTLSVYEWISFINHLPKDLAIVLVGGKLEYKSAEEIKNICSDHQIFNTCGQVALLESIVIMSKASRNYVLDSAPLHMCSALNLPVTAIFLKTSPEDGFYPLSDDTLVVDQKVKLKRGAHDDRGHHECAHHYFYCQRIT